MEVIIQILLIDLHKLFLTLYLICRTFPDDVLEACPLFDNCPEQAVLKVIIYLITDLLPLQLIVSIACNDRPFTVEVLQWVTVSFAILKALPLLASNG